ncbi:MAG: GNAT family N-acetyltransferase [Thermoflexibacter sp.]|jgi:RimJ/RimL family protein N-acetyltransferase|nr:GNAT family N-acetyltransferase [Thermoflexibacter sp.]
MQKYITTDRLCLRFIAMEDTEFIISLVNTEGWLTFIGDRNVHTQSEARTYIEKLLNTEDLFYWVVSLKEHNIPIGIVSFLKRAYLEHFDIGFALLPDFYGHGYAYEATREVLSMVSKNPIYRTVLATVIPHNTKSINLLKKLGLYFDKEINYENSKLHIYTTNQMGI